MSENFIRHLVSIIGTIILAIAYFAGYISGGSGTWWTVFSVVFVYFIIYKLVKV